MRNYSEAAYFDGDHAHHCAARAEHLRLIRRRVADVSDAGRYPNIAAALEHARRIRGEVA